MVSWSAIQSAVIFFGPILWPRLKSFYQTIQNPPHPPRPLPYTPRLLLNFLFASCLIALLSTFPFFHPENVIQLTNSRLLHTSTDVIFNRLHQLRPPIPSDTLLKSRFTSRDGRLLYSLYGPGPLTNCTWCRIDAPETFLLYALPAILIPHLLHILILGIVTSAHFLSGPNKAGAIWRTQATLAGLLIAASEIWYISTYNHADNILAKTASDAVFPHWQLTTYRGLAIALVDAALGYAIYLTGTGRWGALIYTSPAEALEAVAAQLENSVAGVNSAVCMKQAVMRDHALRAQAVRFWETEELTGRELAQTEEVRAARKRVEKRGDWARVRGEARKRARAVARGLFVKRQPMKEEDDEAEEWEDERGGSQEVKQEESQESARSGGYFGEGQGEEEFVGTWEEELEVEGMQGWGSSQPSSMAGSYS